MNILKHNEKRMDGAGGAVETDRGLYLVYRYPGLINHMGVNGFTPVAFHPHVCIKYNP